ncbi:MAG: hydrogenase iron-sulfur subunit [Proteobacteria bacterium]|nr:hydrogenase iron-sulfur subunit [Desulfobacula sp.]MBU3953593.1 hydrogenase iron-sulfur subunit [Pseudomonadota bacterium]MBU4130245.1 hydrogenase iron-sulfur subunit [Pseudomonadota bacterium]
MENFEPEIVAFCCHYCAYTAADMAGSKRISYPSNVKIIRVPCTGKVDAIHIMKALEKGADGVYVAGCLEGDCHFKTGNTRAKQRVDRVKKILEDLGWEPERVAMINMSAGMGERFAKTALEFTQTIKTLGPNPVRHAKTETQAVG